MTAAEVYGIEIVKGLGTMGLVVGLLSGKNWSDRLFSIFATSLLLLLAWPLVGGVIYVLVNLAAEAFEGMGAIEIEATLRLLIAKIGTFGFLVLFCARHVWEELNAPHAPRGRAVFGPPKAVYRRVAR